MVSRQPPPVPLEGAGRFHVSFGPRPNLFLDLFYVAWLAPWAYGFVAASPNVTDTGDATPATVLAGIGWILFLCTAPTLVAGLLLFDLAGRQALTLDWPDLQIRRSLGPLAYRRWYPVASIADVRALPSRTSSKYEVAFAFDGQTVRFGKRLREREAEALARRLAAAIAPARAGGAHVPAVMRFRYRDGLASKLVVGGFTTIWLMIWTGGGIAALGNSKSELLADYGRIGWIAGILVWLFGVALGLGFLVIPIVTRQTMTPGPAALEIRTALGPVGLTRRYDWRAIHRVRVVPLELEDGPDDEAFQVAFDCEGKTVEFGLSLAPGEAEAIATELNERLTWVRGGSIRG
jgi:hypothetical protein